jgi:cobalt-zinc-cadmium resistance protein CzcA
MRWLITQALKRRWTTLIGALALAVIGLLAVREVPFDAFPDLTGTRVEVITVAPGMAPEDVERLVTYPVEQSLMGLPGAEGVRSVSKYGLSLVTVPFPDGTDIYFARTIVAQRLGDAKEYLPPGIEATLGPVSTPMGELYQYTLHSDSLSLTDLKTLQDFVIRPRLRTVPGVAEVNSWGGLTERIDVVVDPVRLAARGLTVTDVHRALAENNVPFGGSFLEKGGERFTLRGLGRLESPAEIAQVVVASRGGMPVRVGDVADVAQGALPRNGSVTKDAHGEVVAGMVLKLRGEDSRAVIQAVKARMAEIKAALPSTVELTEFYDQSELVGRTSKTIIKNLIEGGLLVIAVLFLFLRNVRASLIVASVIPISMLIAFTALWLSGESANLMSLGALDFGLIVDASVVMVENFIRRLEEGEPPDEDSRAALFRKAAIEVGRPVLFGIAIIVAVYIPIFTLTGMEGRMFKPMAFTVVTAVLGSLLLALTYVPAISAWLLEHAEHTRSPFFEAIRSRYERLLEGALHHGRIVVIGSIGAIVLAIGSLAFIGSEFMPKLDEGAILITTRRLPSISLADATRLSMQAEKIVKDFPEVITVVTKEGRPDLATEAMGLFEGDMYVILKERKEWTTAKTREGLVAALDSALADIPGLEVAFTQPLAMRLDEAESGIKTDLGIKVFGPDMDRNLAMAERIRRVVSTVPGAADVALEVADGSGQVALRPDRDALARYGLSIAAVGEALELATGARPATELIQGPRRIPVATTYPEGARGDVLALSRLTLRAPGGELVPLGAVASLEPTTGPELIGHENAERRAIVLANVRGTSLGAFAAEVKARVAAEVPLPPGMHLEWGGQYENQQRAMSRLGIVVPLSILLIFALLYLSFRDVLESALVLANVPFALVGGVAVLWLRGLNLSISAAIGFIALFGIAVLNGVVLVTHTNSLRDEGMELEAAVRQGAIDRLRPVLMTALVASLGFIPMAVSTSAGAEVQRPLASVVIGGLVTSTLLTLLVLPTLYRGLMRWEERREEARRQRGAAGAVSIPAMASASSRATAS